MKPKLFAVFVALTAGCNAATSQSVQSLEAEVRRLRTEQERQATQIEQLQSRVILTEDAARAARNAVQNADRRTSISLGTTDRPVEPIRVDSSQVNGDEPDAPETPSIPAVRISRGDRIPEGTPFVVHPPNERLPVVPVPPPPPQGAPNLAPGAPTTPTSHGVGPSTAAPTTVPGVSTGTLDPQAVGAYEEALRMARHDRCPEAIDAFARFLVRWPDHPHADNAMYWRGECYLRGGDSRRAAQEFEGLIARFPAGNKVPDALYKLATTWRRLGDEAAARRAVQRLTTEFPDSEPARRMRGERESQ